MNWHYINSGFNTGKFNMEFDLYLTRYCTSGEAYLRVYRWNPYCISLGANQNINSINSEKASKDYIDVVTRPTGGRAILHSEEITYSVVLPISHNSSAREIYNEINSALLEGLNFYDKRLYEAELENLQPDFSSFYKEEEGAICFAASAKSEVKYDGKKLIGSAQRKLNNSILQHGSILCGDYHTKIVNYLNLNSETSENLTKSITNKTTDIKSILNEEVDYKKLADCISKGFEKYFDISFSPVTREIILTAASS